MSYQPLSSVALPGPFVSTMSPESPQVELRCLGGGGVASAVWPSANRVLFCPIWLPSPLTIASFWWINGTVVSGNVDVGIYTASAGLPAALLAHTGSTVQAGTSAIQSVNVTQYLAPGEYYLAMQADNVTATYYRGTGSGGVSAALKSCGFCDFNNTAMPLPSAPTAIHAQANYYPICGFATTTLV